MEKQLNTVLRLSLEEIALRRVVVMLWNQMNILALFQVNDSVTGLCNLNKGLVLVQNKLSGLGLTKSLLNKAMPLVKPVGLEIKHWLDFHVVLLRLENIYLNTTLNRILKELSWTSVGTVNYRKTAEKLIQHNMLHLLLFYPLACFYCLEDCVLSEGYCFYKWNNFVVTQQNLCVYWTNFLNEEDRLSDDMPGQWEDMTNFYQQALKKSVCLGNKAATEYFYQKLKNKEKQISLFKLAEEVATHDDYDLMACALPPQQHSDVLCYLLSQMIPKERMELLAAHPYSVLNCFLEWPWQDHFLDVAQLAWEFLSKDDYCSLLSDLCAKEAISGYIKVDLFREFFRHSPIDFKNYFLDKQFSEGKFLYTFFDTEDNQIVKCIFRNIDATSKATLIICDQGLEICYNLIKGKKWCLLKMFIREAMLSKEDAEMLQEDLKSYISANYKYADSRHKTLKRLFSLSERTD